MKLMKVFDVHAPSPQGPAAKDQQAFLIGVNFHEAALRVGLEEHDPAGAPIAALCPMIVCYAFAAELYLKSLIPTVIRNHRLNVLYKNLDTQTRSDVADSYKSRTGRDHHVLEEDLRRMAAAFADWRYIFEGEGQQLRVNLLIAFTKAIYETVKLHRPDWKVSPFQDERLLADNPSMTVANLGGGTFLHVIDGPSGKLNDPHA
jgi:hypothetical protein